MVERRRSARLVVPASLPDRESALTKVDVSFARASFRCQKLPGYLPPMMRWTILAPLLVLGCSAAPPVPDAADRVREASGATVYEGLPHPKSESESYDLEKKTQKTLQIGGYDFYEEPLILPQDDLQELRDLCSDPKTYAPVVDKKCGAFHPDYAAIFRRGAEETTVLFCFRCEEIETLVGGKAARYDMSNPTKLGGLLKRYRQHRPASSEKR
jgi:hypothetical protein